MEQKQKVALGITAIVIVGAIVLLGSGKSSSRGGSGDMPVVLPSSMNTAQKGELYLPAQEITTPDGFVNTDAIAVADLVGKKVILLDFWTYSCINCQRTFPYLNAWHEKYKDQGLAVIGVHTPEFKFEEKYENVARAVSQFGITYPVVLDNDYSTWQGYRNHYWPRKYLIDIDGFIVYDHIGEGGYEETEQKIQDLLAERLHVLGEEGTIARGMVTPKGVEKATAGLQRTPELYFGATRNEHLGNGTPFLPGEQTFESPRMITRSRLYLDGTWHIEGEFAETTSESARIILKYRAGRVFMVASADKGATLTLLRDGEPLSQEGGSDVVDAEVVVQDERLYRLVEDPDGFGEHTLEIIINNPGFRAFTFTFG